MKPVSELLTRLMPRVVGCPEPLALQALVDSGVEFCEKSLVVRHTLDTVTTRSGVQSYSLDAPSQQRAARVLSVTYDGRTINAVPPGNPGELDFGGVPLAYSTRFDGPELLLELYPTPNAPGSLVVQIAAAPTLTASSFEDELVTRWYDAILAGAWARLMSTPNQPFTNFDLAAAYNTMYRAETAKALADGFSGRVQSSRTVKLRPFA